MTHDSRFKIPPHVCVLFSEHENGNATLVCPQPGGKAWVLVKILCPSAARNLGSGPRMVSWYHLKTWTQPVSLVYAELGKLVVQSLLCLTLLQSHGLYIAHQVPLSISKNTGVGSYSLLQGIFLTQGWNQGLLHCRQILYCLSHQGSCWVNQRITKKTISSPPRGSIREKEPVSQPAEGGLWGHLCIKYVTFFFFLNT